MPGPNLVQNSGFETGDLTDWTVSDPEPGNPDIGVDNQPLDVNSGTYGLFAGNETSTLSQSLATTAGHTYTISFYLDVYQSTAFNGGVTATFGSQTAFNLVEPTETDSFVQYTTQITATSSFSTLEFAFTDPGGYFGVDDISVVDEAACYLRGTRLLTDRGEIAIEALQIGDQLVTASGGLRPVRWIGRRALDCARHRDPQSVWPIRVRAGAFGIGLPRRDLWLSPEHGVDFGGALAPISTLMNGVSVKPIEIDRVEYWHVELDAHDIVLAEGLATESYLDTGNRTAFDNGGEFVEAHPDFRPRHWTQTCLPMAFDGPAVDAARARLLARLDEQGYVLTDEADAHMLVDGVRIAPIRLSDMRLAFVLPEGGRQISLCSRTFVPTHTLAGAKDARTLGLCVRSLQVDGAHLPFDGPMTLATGWNDAEFDGAHFSHRWTTGATWIQPGARIVIVDLAGQGSYWRQPEPRIAACA